jgi:hypothetical protein
MTPALRKFTITAHVTFSVGWLGAVAAFIIKFSRTPTWVLIGMPSPSASSA